MSFTSTHVLVWQPGEWIAPGCAKKKARCSRHRAMCVRFLISANWQPALSRPTRLGVGGIRIIIIIIQNTAQNHQFTFLELRGIIAQLLISWDELNQRAEVLHSAHQT
jgi:hypothetical protein